MEMLRVSDQTVLSLEWTPRSVGRGLLGELSVGATLLRTDGAGRLVKVTHLAGSRRS
jgi:hypothetical protein